MSRVVVTGIGLITPLGIGVEDNITALVQGKSGIGPITQFDASAFPTRIAGEVKGFDPSRYLDKREMRWMDRFLQFAVAAGQLAMADSGLPSRFEGESASRAGCYVGAGMGGMSTLEKTYAAFLEKGPRHGFSPYFVPSIIVNMAPGLLSMKHNLKGPVLSHVSACATGAHSIGEALRVIQIGACDVMLAGGVEASVCILGTGGFMVAKALSTRNDEPTRASRPFDADRDGFVLSEGAGVLVLEELERAKRRRARIYAELVGYASTSDAYHITQPSPDGEGAERCVRMALENAHLAREDIQYVNAHGTSTPLNDAIETRVIKRVFDEHARKLAISSTKSMTGHLLGAAGAVEAAYSALALERCFLPPTINYETPDPECDLDYVPNQARAETVNAVLSNSFGFGGANAALILARYKGN